MQIIIDLRLNLVRELLNDKALEGDAEQRLTALLVHRYEEESPALTPIPRPVRELLHAYCLVAMRTCKKAFTFDHLHTFLMGTEMDDSEDIQEMLVGVSLVTRRTILSGQYVPILRRSFAQYVITEKPTLPGPGVTQHLLPLDGSVDSYVVRCRESTESK